MFNWDGGTSVLTDCLLLDNSAAGLSRGTFSYNGGGGVCNTTLSTATLTDCLLIGNSASGPAVGLCYGGGGVVNLHSATLTGCTLTGNSTSTTGGGVFNEANFGFSTTTTLSNCTISGNSAVTGGGIANAGSGGVVNVGNTIVAGNTASTSGPDAQGAIVSLGHNLIGKTDGSTGWVSSDRTGTGAHPLDPLLAPLGYYGGPTQTMALLPGSPAIDAGGNALIPAGVTTDQRGFSRVVNGTVDIGAFEVQAQPLLVNTTADGNTTPPGQLDLRQAVNLANATPGNRTITFDPTVFATPKTITLNGTQLELSNTTGTETVTGPAAGVTIDGGGRAGCSRWTTGSRRPLGLDDHRRQHRH